MSKTMRTRKLITMAMLSCAALVIFVAEAQIPPVFSMPGIKLGLANIITLITMKMMGKRPAAAVLAVRIILGNIFTGQMLSFLYSFMGGLACFLIMGLIVDAFDDKQLWIVSVFGAIAHNMGQILTAAAIFGTWKIMWYVPYLLIAAVLTGAFTGFCAQITLSKLTKIEGFIRKEK